MSDTTDLLKLAFVPRWAIIPLFRPQSVLEHSFNVAIIARAIAREAGIREEYWSQAGYHRGWDTLTWLALAHDREECRTGDIPSTAKPDNGIKPHLDIIQQIIKIADLLEARLYIQRWGHPMASAKVASYLSAKMEEFFKVYPILVEPVVKVKQDIMGGGY